METEQAGTPPRPPLWFRLTFGANPSWTVLRILFLVLVSFVLFKFVFGLVKVEGSSMYPTCTSGQIKVVNRLAYLKNKPQRGDIVTLYYAGKQVLLLKRVIGLPGEKVHIWQGAIYIDDEKLAEPYANGRIPRPKKPFVLEANQYYLIGDNREVSEDYIEPDYQIFGKVIF